MGLAERRRIAEIKATLPEFQQKMDALAGYSLPFSFDTETLPEDPDVLSSYDFYKDYVMPGLLRIFEDILKDDLGKEAVKKTIQAIRVSNTSTNGDDSGSKGLVLKDGELHVTFGFYRYSDQIWDEAALKAEIEKML